MAILKGFKKVKQGAIFAGVLVDHIQIDTKSRFHLMPENKLHEMGLEAIAIIETDGVLSDDKSREETQNIFWLWENLKVA